MASRPNTTQTQGAIGQLELPSGKYAEINDINPTLRTKARDAPNPILPRAAGRRAWPATIREREPLVSSLIGRRGIWQQPVSCLLCLQSSRSLGRCRHEGVCYTVLYNPGTSNNALHGLPVGRLHHMYSTTIVLAGDVQGLGAPASRGAWQAARAACMREGCWPAGHMAGGSTMCR
jgi:hypothetical protein